MSELKLWLDAYDDIYSDFDSRHFKKRRISEDFMYELHRELKFADTAARRLSLVLPLEKRNIQSEEVIGTALQDFFISQASYHRKRCIHQFRKGISTLSAGLLLMFLYAWLNISHPGATPILALRVVLEPGGWFLVWTGLDLLFYNLPSLRREGKSFEVLSEMDIQFASE